MFDPFVNYQTDLSSPAVDLWDLAPDDDNDLPVCVRGLAVAESGNVRITTVRGTTVSIYIAAGAPWPVRVSKVWATGTDATGIVGLV